MAWYRSIEIDRGEITEPKFVTEYSYFIQQQGAVTQTFTVVTPGLYFLSANGVSVGTSATYPYTFSVSTAHAPVYETYIPDNFGKCSFIYLDADDVVTFSADSSSRTDYAKRQAFLAIRIVNATFVSRISISTAITYSPPMDSNLHLIFATNNTIRWDSDVSDTSIIPEECTSIKVGSASQGLVTYVVGSVNDNIYINTNGGYGSKRGLIDFLLTPISPDYSKGGNYDVINKGVLIDNTYIDARNGAEVPYNNWSSTDFIDIEGLSDFYMSNYPSGDNAPYNAFYDSNKAFISSFSMSGHVTSIPQNAKYMRLSSQTYLMNGITLFRSVPNGKNVEELTITFEPSMEDTIWTCVSSDGKESFSGTVDSTLTVTLDLGLKNTVYLIQCNGVTAEYISGGISIVDFNNLSKFPNAMKNLAMNSNIYTDSNGYVFKASASSERFPAYNAFDGSLGSGASEWWRPNDFSVNGWLMLEVPIDCKILSHTIYLENDSTSTVEILFQGSNDGVNFETLGNADFGTNSGYLERTVTLVDPNAYKYYRWYYATNTGGSGTYLREITFNTVNVNSAPTPTAYEPGVLSMAGSPATLPFDTSSDNHIIVDYEIPYNVTNMSVCGTSSGSAHSMHITTWGDALYIGIGSGEYVVGTGSSYTEGRHTFEFNRNGYIYFDDAQGNAITPSNDAITIGGKGGYNLYGIIYSVEIKSNSTGDTLLKLVPDEQNGALGFTDEISNTFYQYGHKMIYSEINT